MQEQPPNKLTHKQAFKLTQDLRKGNYDPVEIAGEYRADFNGVDGQPFFNAIAISFMCRGHIALAEQMVKLGADPRGVVPEEFQWGLSNVSIKSHGRAPGIAYLLADWDRDALALTGQESEQIKARLAVLSHVLARPGKWHAGINEQVNGNTALVHALSKHNTYSRWARSKSARIDYSEVGRFQQALVDAGAEVNPVGAENNLLEASLPDYHIDGPTQDKVGEMLDRAIGWGVNIETAATTAWARAIRQDVDVRYPKKATVGPRVAALKARGVPLHSPVNACWRVSPLYQAVELGFLPLVDHMIKLGVDPCWVDPSTRDTLLSANHDPKGNTMEAIRRFPKGALTPIINAKAHDGDTALHRATNSLNAAMVEFLLDNGADINALNKKKQKPLQALRRSGDKAQEKFDALMEVMLRHDVDLGADKRSSALHKAARLLSGKAVAHLLKEGNDPNVVDYLGHTPAEEVIIGHQANLSSFFNVKRGVGQVEVLKALQEAGVDLTAPLKGGSTLLHKATSRGAHMVARYLIEQGADPHALDAENKTPMHTWNDRSFVFSALKPKNEPHIIDMIVAFMEAGADMDLLSPDGKLPFEAARKMPGVVAAVERAVLDADTVQVGRTTSQPGRRRRL